MLAYLRRRVYMECTLGRLSSLSRYTPNINPLSVNAPYFGILLCLTPDDFTLQVASAATQWVNKKASD
jgi:hypothetical protein